MDDQPQTDIISIMSKYKPDNLLPALRLFVEARNKSVAAGFTDNGGAIHSVERILDILGQRLRYPHLRHTNNLKRDPTAEISAAAHAARRRGEVLKIEHVMPQRAFALQIIGQINEGKTDEDLTRFIRANYRLVLLTMDETTALNRTNRSRLSADRIAEAGITLHDPGGA